jgi:hypothetical protein
VVLGFRVKGEGLGFVVLGFRVKGEGLGFVVLGFLPGEQSLPCQPSHTPRIEL